MSTAKKVFFWIFGLSLGLGLLLGLLNLVMPELVSVTLNNENVEGITALWTSLFSAAIPGLIFALMGAGVAALFSRKKKD